MDSILYKGKMRVENQTKPRVWEDSILCPETCTVLKMPFKNSILGTPRVIKCSGFLYFIKGVWCSYSR